MINELHGNVLDAPGIIIHGVNCMGTMGAGVALQVRQRWPEAYEEYQAHCRRQPLMSDLLGTILHSLLPDGRILIHAFTQQRYGRTASASYDAIDSCFEKACGLLDPIKRSTIGFPLIGCGHGKLHYPVVREIIDHRIPDMYTKNLYIL